MIVVDNLKCKLCNKQYLGIFKVTSDLGVQCIDCNNKTVIDKIKVNKNNQKLEQEMVINYLEEDIQYLYPLIYNMDNINIDQFLNEDGIPDAYKIYYQGNDLDFCVEFRRMAYKCLDYLDTNKDTYINFCENFIEKYLNLRFKKLNDSDIKKVNDDINSETFKNILLEIGVD